MKRTVLSALADRDDRGNVLSAMRGDCHSVRREIVLLASVTLTANPNDLRVKRNLFLKNTFMTRQPSSRNAGERTEIHSLPPNSHHPPNSPFDLLYFLQAYGSQIVYIVCDNY